MLENQLVGTVPSAHERFRWFISNSSIYWSNNSISLEAFHLIRRPPTTLLPESFVANKWPEGKSGVPWITRRTFLWLRRGFYGHNPLMSIHLVTLQRVSDKLQKYANSASDSVHPLNVPPSSAGAFLTNIDSGWSCFFWLIIRFNWIPIITCNYTLITMT